MRRGGGGVSQWVVRGKGEEWAGRVQSESGGTWRGQDCTPLRYDARSGNKACDQDYEGMTALYSY